MALPGILAAGALRAGIRLLTTEGPKAVAKKYGKEGLKQVEKARRKQLRDIDAKAGFTGGKTIANPQKTAETLKRKARERRNKRKQTQDLLNPLKTEQPLRFKKGGKIKQKSNMGLYGRS